MGICEKTLQCVTEWNLPVVQSLFFNASPTMYTQIFGTTFLSVIKMGEKNTVKQPCSFVQFQEVVIHEYGDHIALGVHIKRFKLQNHKHFIYQRQEGQNYIQ